MAKIHEMTTPADRALAAMQLNGEPRRPEQPERERPLLVGALPDRIRHRFPIFQKRLYINSCSQGALSDSVREAYARYLEDWDERGAPWEYWVEKTEDARRVFARLVDADPDEVAVTTSLSAGLSAIATGLRYARRPKIVLTDWEFPTVGRIWHAQELRGARVIHVSADGDGTIPFERFEQAIDDETAMVSITHVCYRNGAMVDVEKVVQLAHERGALVLLDAYQSAGSLPLAVRDRLVRRPKRLREGPPRLLAGRGRAPLPVGHAADPVHLCRHRRDGADGGDRDRGDTRPRARAELSSDRRARRPPGHPGDAAAPEEARCAHLRALDRCIRSRRRTRARGDSHLVTRRQSADLGPLLQLDRRHRRGACGAQTAPQALRLDAFRSRRYRSACRRLWGRRSPGRRCTWWSHRYRWIRR